MIVQLEHTLSSPKNMFYHHCIVSRLDRAERMVADVAARAWLDLTTLDALASVTSMNLPVLG